MFLGLDYGTSEVKALLLNTAGQIIATQGAPLTVSRPQAIWSEQDPADWWAATIVALEELRAQVPKEYAEIQAIGLSGQMHGAVLLDAHNQVLRPAILWNDVRSHLECEELTAAVPNLYTLAGNLAMPVLRHQNCCGSPSTSLKFLPQHEKCCYPKITSGSC